MLNCVIHRLYSSPDASAANRPRPESEAEMETLKEFKNLSFVPLSELFLRDISLLDMSKLESHSVLAILILQKQRPAREPSVVCTTLNTCLSKCLNAYVDNNRKNTLGSNKCCL